MSKKHKKALCALIVSVLPILSFAQSNASSPYSIYGVGDLSDVGFGRNRAMGGVNTPLMSQNHLNPYNPASYIGLAPKAFLFEFGASMYNYETISPSAKSSAISGNINYLAAGFHVTKWWKAGAGLKPVSNINYQLNSIDRLSNGTAVGYSYNGKGGLSSFYLDNSFKILKSLSLGVKAAYMFGSLDRTRIAEPVAGESSSISTSLSETESATLDAPSFGLGLHYHKMFTEDYIFSAGIVYNLNTKLKGDLSRKVTVKQYNTNTVYYDATEVLKRGTLDLPESYSFGASFLYNQKLEVAADYKMQSWSDASYFGEKLLLADDKKLSIGLEYIPDFGSTKYYKLIRYRAGFSKNDTYILYNDKQLTAISGSLGFGFPLRNGNIVNISGSYTQRSVSGDNTLKENILQLHLNLSMKARWFMKFKYD